MLTFQIKSKSDGVVYRIISPKNNAELVFTPDNKCKFWLKWTSNKSSFTELVEHDHQCTDTDRYISMRSIMSDGTLLAVENGKYFVYKFTQLELTLNRIRLIV